MSPLTFLNVVVQPNVQLALQEPGNMRCAVNAVLTIDALAGMLYVDFKRRNDQVVVGLKTDDKYRDNLAEKDESFRILRDLAAAYKHGELTHQKEQRRLVKSPDQATLVPNVIGLFQCGDRVESSVLVVEHVNGRWRRASNMIADSFRLLKDLVDSTKPLVDTFSPA
jgi:hypothetical protein